MKRLLSFILSFLFVSLLANSAMAQKDNQVLMNIAGEDITVGEFMRVYNKNNTQGKVVDKKSIEEYVDLFINFRLKVKQAEEMGMDTLSDFKEELAKYREQLAKPYLIDKDVQERMMREAYENMQHDIRASHILVRLGENASPEDTLKAWKRIKKLRKRIASGESFAKVAREESDDRSARDRTRGKRTIPGNKGDLGYFTAFDMAYSFEKAAYDLKVGEISQPVRTRYGYHIIKLTDKIPAIGKVKVAHIMLRDAGRDSAEAVDMLDSLRTQIREGNTTFAKEAQKHSADKRSGKDGGKLPEFGSNRMVPPFIKTVSKLEEGEISRPVKTRYGYHIIKLLKKDEPGSWQVEKNSLENKISRSSRASKAKSISAQNIREEYNFSLNEKLRDEIIEKVDSNILTDDWEARLDDNENPVLISLGDKQYRQKDFIKYLENHQKRDGKGDPQLYAKSVFQEYLDKITLDFKDNKLEEEYPEFRYLINEYRDGILLFNLMTEKIWSKAMEDTVGLKKYYKKHKDEYMWGKRLHATIYKANKRDAALFAKQLISSGLKPSYIADSVNTVDEFKMNAETDKFSRGDNDRIDKLQWQTGTTDITQENGQFVFVNRHAVLEPEPKKLSEARGLVIADYQNYLEDKWIEKLRDKYEFSVNEKVLKKLN